MNPLDPSSSAHQPFRLVARSTLVEEDLARHWRELESRADCSFFQSWTYTGCLIRERFPDPLVIEAHLGASSKPSRSLVGLALFNRRRGPLGAERLLLGESGMSSFDALFIEDNGPLIARDHVASAMPQLLNLALRGQHEGRPLRPRSRILIMSGVRDEVLTAAEACRGISAIRESRPAPAVDLASVRAGARPFLDCLSANTRYQLRRSARRLAGIGPLSVHRAATTGEGHRWLDSLAELHQASWQARGSPGAFADGNFRRFHHALIDRGLPRHEVDVLKITAGQRCLGYLLNFVFRNRVYAYQSGFDYRLVNRHEKPGLTCHHQAIEMYLRQGLDQYDFLGGAERYKASFSQAERQFHWLQLAARWSPADLLLRLDQVHRAVRGKLGSRKQMAVRDPRTFSGPRR